MPLDRGASRETKLRPGDEDASGGRRLICAQCSHPLTTEAARIEMGGSHQHSFCNPHGLVFDIGCFAPAPGCAAVGAASEFFSWFPGHPWRVAVCGRCGVHVGWSFGGEHFWGLILDRLLEAEPDDE